MLGASCFLAEAKVQLPGSVIVGRKPIPGSGSWRWPASVFGKGRTRCIGRSKRKRQGARTTGVCRKSRGKKGSSGPPARTLPSTIRQSFEPGWTRPGGNSRQPKSGCGEPGCRMPVTTESRVRMKNGLAKETRKRWCPSLRAVLQQSIPSFETPWSLKSAGPSPEKIITPRKR